MKQTLAVVIGLLLFCAASASHAEHRVALLIGNSNYPGARLPSPAKHLMKVKQSLEKHGFRTTMAEDLNWEAMRKTVERFADGTPTCGTALIYFHGYVLPGERNGKKEDCLLSLDCGVRNQRDVANRSYGLNRLTELLETRCGANNIIVLLDGVCKHPKASDEVGKLHTCKELPKGMFVGYGLDPQGEDDDSQNDGTTFADVLVGKLSDKGLSPIKAMQTSSVWSKSTLADSVTLSEPASVAIAPPDQFTVGQKAGDEWVNNRGMVFCWCPPGQYIMGSPEDEAGRLPDEKKQTVTFKEGFWIAKYEMTIRENLRGKPRGDVLGKSKNHPITLINLDDAKRMGRVTLTQLERKAGGLPKDWGYDLPTEQEWEYAARAGSKTCFSFGDDVNQLPQYGNFADKNLYETGDFFYNYANRTMDDGTAFVAPVGSYKPNAWGLHDVHGNVAEWCVNQEMRGGSFQSLPSYCRSAQKNSWPNRQQQNFLGYRFVIRKGGAKKK